MPTVTCFLVRPGEEVHRFLLADPRLAPHAYRLDHVTTVRVPSGAWSEAERAAAGLAPALERFAWLKDALPAPELVSEMWAIAQATRAPIAWFYWEEHGDDLYADAAWVLDPTPPRGPPPWLELPASYEHLVVVPSGRWLYVRQTALMGEGGDSASFALDDRGTPVEWSGSPLVDALRHLEIATATEYLVAEDRSDFDWERHRLRADG